MAGAGITRSAPVSDRSHMAQATGSPLVSLANHPSKPTANRSLDRRSGITRFMQEFLFRRNEACKGLGWRQAALEAWGFQSAALLFDRRQGGLWRVRRGAREGSASMPNPWLVDSCR